ncbi:hypothetical protein [Enterococcus canintestini]|uniref:Uncharacterized protein n=1 Tax=Enterococcus canintestini TaxID=317010 RepID=A0A267HTB3_9ENTE|nr:hypothetical protein [Enterococcus canintestini]PAB01586.1 hypothetical protein AKL21_03780 [Enterococcus canintestini]
MKKFFIHGIVLVILASSLVVLFCQLVETTPQALAYTTTTYEKNLPTKSVVKPAINLTENKPQKTIQQTFSKKRGNLVAFGLGSILALLAIWRRRKN